MGDAAETSDAPAKKRFLYVNRKAPHGTVYALEVLEMILVSAMFEQDVHVAFLDDGVFQLRKNQTPAVLEMKDFSKTYRALEDYGIEKIFLEKELMEERGLSSDDFIIPAAVLDRKQMAELMELDGCGFERVRSNHAASRQQVALRTQDAGSLSPARYPGIGHSPLRGCGLRRAERNERGRGDQQSDECIRRLRAGSGPGGAGIFDPAAVVDGVQTIDYDGFVDLTIAKRNVQSWL